MAVTPNYGWPVPIATDLVKDGYSAIANLGDAIDATVFGLPSGGLTLITDAAPSATATINVNNCFSASYQNYIIIMNMSSSGDADMTMQLRVGGANSTSGYRHQKLSAENTSVSAARNTSASNWIAGVTRSSGRYFATLNVSNPFAAQASAYSINVADPSGPRLDILIGDHSTATSYDGISFAVGAGLLTGSVRIYGVQN